MDSLFGPLVLSANLIFLLGSKVILDVESFADLLGRFALDHICNGLAADIQESFDVHVIGSEDDLEEHLLVNLHELLIPLLNISGLLTGIGIVFIGRWRIVLVMFAPLDEFLEDRASDVWNWNGFQHDICSKIANHVLDQDRSLGDFAIFGALAWLDRH